MNGSDARAPERGSDPVAPRVSVIIPYYENPSGLAQVLDGIEAAGTARETVLNLWVDPDDLLTAESISQMVNQGMDDLRMEIKGRRPVPMMMTRGGAM